MKQSFLTVAFAIFLLVGCGGGDDTALSQADYVAQGNSICAQMLVELTELEAGLSDNPDRDEFTRVAQEGSKIGGEAIDELVALAPPAEFTGDHDRLVALLDVRSTAQGRLAQGEDALDALEQANLDLEELLISIWPNCRA